MAKQRTQRALINIEYEVVKPWVHAGALASGCAAFAVPLAAPILSWACIGAGFSFFWYWGKNNLNRPRTRKKPISAANTVVVNSVGGTRKVRTFEYTPGFITREPLIEMLHRKVRHRLVRQRPESQVTISHLRAPREFVFLSQYEGQIVEIREDDLRRFLRAAWKYRLRGVGLGHRHWVREWRKRPQWYKDLGPYWYKAVLVLIGHAQQLRGKQLIVCTGPQWYALARDPHITLGLLREAEAMKGNGQPDTLINADGTNSFL